ncbi:MAG: malto-oligosyltrehalose trehalohydrolase, partial [Klebsiella grimontii]|nr:malto-oligosyltrehalose trehalohydrolase [Klebsiella grimontii]MDU4312209.1 malto-oligosyltrehalose trehalohydrolase [Klebsiella michiganensis]
MESISFHKHWGAEFIAADTVRFRVWAEGQKTMTLSLKTRDIPMEAAGGGWFQIDVPGVKHGDEYMLLLADGRRIPDPATRAQRDDVNGPSVVIDPRLFQPVNRVWKGRPWEETVIYELHPGTFTPEGTFLAAIDKLPYLAE